MCGFDKEQIYNNYCQAVAAYIVMGEERLRQCGTKSSTDFLEEFYLRWSRFLTYINRMTKVFGYLDRFYTPNSMVRSTYSEGTFQFGSRVVQKHLQRVLHLASDIHSRRTSSKAEINSIRFALAALIDACSVCQIQSSLRLKILSCLRSMWSEKMRRELQPSLPLSEDGLINKIVDYMCPTCFLNKSSESVPGQKHRQNWRSDSSTSAMDKRRLTRLLNESYILVFGQKHLQWQDRKDSKIISDGPLLVSHAKELNSLKNMGFTNHRRNVKLLRWTWGNLDETINILSKPANRNTKEHR
mmetsp:Transcript_23321/g.34914  ORF Transcript_23321/g.34914 Transcript_23321/m.34914 type:complete len:299 (+) Transcript_23321:584-1480(+)